MRLKRWISVAGLAAAMAAGTLAVGAGPASADSLSIVKNGCFNSGGVWYDYYRESPYRYLCKVYFTGGSYNFYYYYASGELYKFESGRVNTGNIRPF